MSRKFMQNVIQIIITGLFLSLIAPVFFDTDALAATTVTPAVTGDMWPNTFSEDYDSDAMVNIPATFSSITNLQVYFGSVTARKLAVSSSPAAIEAYLPIGSSSLDPGIYDVTIEYQSSGASTSSAIKTFSGGLNIVAHGKIAPDSENLVDESHIEGDVSKERNTSSDVLNLSKSYSQRNSLEFDMDDLFGPDTMLRKIVFDMDSGARDPAIQLNSKWFDVTVHNFAKLKTGDADATLSINRIAGAESDSLIQSLRYKPLNSAFAQIKIEGATVDSFSISLPLVTEPTLTTKAIRYDENTRKWSYAKTFIFDAATQRIIISDDKPGIFAVID